jgi:hypothetical protein
VSDATDIINDDLILAAIERAEHHHGYQGAPDWEIVEHLSVARRSKKAGQVKARLPELVRDGFLGESRRHGVSVWATNAKARKRLAQVPEATASLPESPQHRKWREARDAAEQEIEGFYLGLRDAVDATADLLSEPMPPGPPSDAWFEMAERLHRACRRLGSATHILHEWAEPSDDKADDDEHRDPSDTGLTPDEQRRRRSYIQNSSKLQRTTNCGRSGTRSIQYSNAWR